MAVRFSEEQVVEATGGRRLRAGSRSSYEAVCTDSRKLLPGCLFVALQGERFDAHQFLPEVFAGGAAGAVVEKGKALSELPAHVGLFEVENTLYALGGLARYHRRRFKIPLGAVTGSNGKTTTKEMVGAILATRGPALKTEGNLNNEVGVPLTLFELSPQHVAAVVEMGMNHPGEISRLTAIAEPNAGLITVVQAAHLKGLGSLEGVAAAKGELFLGLPKAGTAVVNLDEPLIVAQAKRSGADVLTFGRAADADVRLESATLEARTGLGVRIHWKGSAHPVRLAFVGAHNAHNACAAFALAVALGYTAVECVQGLERARPYPRRLNVLSAPGDVTLLDDCYNANPASMTAAFSALKELSAGGRAVAVLGDMLELGDGESAAHRRMGEEAGQVARLAAFVGPRSAEAYAASGLGEGGAHFLEVEPLLAWLRPRLAPGDVVLVKASRGMRLERVVDALLGRSSGGGGH
jgi:UDP-N-acetylmuramoyl-tripeptide--D-alanyl-D-alanine ligase